MNQGALSFSASLQIASNWIHRQNTTPKERKRDRQTELARATGQQITQYYQAEHMVLKDHASGFASLAYVLEITYTLYHS